MAWWQVNIITEVSGEPANTPGGYVNSDLVSALVPVSFHETVNNRDVWYVQAVGPDVPADQFLNTPGYLSVTDAQNAAQRYCGGRND